ncbi:uncharacterized protein LOC129728827 [Wyeomyia smithii]|uniref:uncharacterized protein LOC129728827 n=1 Tax=Wyeomyia smithii TaxID=174621 RepID=UPI0024680AC8|nr:uncharacterized protein LOC129728827 [Wyeomyia smithii]
MEAKQQQAALSLGAEQQQQPTSSLEAEQRQRIELRSAIDRFMRRAEKHDSVEPKEAGKYVRPLPTSVYDNGAAGSGSDKHLRVTERKSTEKLIDELSEVKAELERTRFENEELSRIVAEIRQNGNEFYDARSSTMCNEHSTANETLLATMSNMSLSSLNIPECVPVTSR